MKKTLLLLLAASVGQVAFGQQIISENFSTFTVGNLGTDVTGVTEGQNGWYTFASNGATPTTTTNAANENFQIVASEGGNGNALQITGPNGNKGSRIAWQAGLDGAWAERTEGNILEVEYDFYTGAETTSTNNMRVVIYDETQTIILGGFSFAMNTKVLSGVAYYDATSQGGQVTNYLFYLGEPDGETPTNIVLEPNTWVRLGVSFNYETGEVIWKGPGFAGNVPGAATGIDPYEADIAAVSGSTTALVNVSATTGVFDNLVARVSLEDTLLGVQNPTFAAAQFSVYPNPVSNVVNISNTQNVAMQSAQITDLNGRTVKSVNLNGANKAEINVSEITTGVYMLNIATENGKISKKIIKN